MDWRQFLCEEIDRKIALIRLLMPARASIAVNGEDSETDTYFIPEIQDQVAPIAALLAHEDLIPRVIDQNACAQSRKPSDMIFQGCSTSLFQASQQWSTISS
jgi:hypothetical protein